MHTETNKKTAVDFLTLVIEGKIDEAFEKYADMSGKHHNPFTAAGFSALKDGMRVAAITFPYMQFDVKRVVGDEKLVAVHSKMMMEECGEEHAVVHLLRFENEKIVEIWDIAQAVPPDSPNTDGMF